MSVTCQVKNYKALRKQIEDMKKAPRKVLTAVTADAKKRVPGWVATEVSKVYGVKKGEITGKKIGTVQTKGNSIEEVKIIYKGRLLTPARFGMTPKAPGKNAYTLKAQIIRGQKKTLGKVKKMTKKQRASLQKGSRNSPQSPWMLQRTGANSDDKIQYIPFQRREQPGKMKYVMKTLSLPQMVSSERTEKGIQTAINDGLGKRLDHHMQRYMGK